MDDLESRTLTPEEVAILIELQKFAATTLPIDGSRYTTIIVPMGIWDKMSKGIPYMPVGTFGPQKAIPETVDRMVNEYIRRNPSFQDPTHLRLIRIEATQSAIIAYLQKLYDRGVLPR